jgi:hypothetical protein
MAAYKLISADAHIVEPPDTYLSRIGPKFRHRAPRMERLETPAGRTGAQLSGPTAADVPTCEVRVGGEQVYVKRGGKQTLREGSLAGGGARL